MKATLIIWHKIYTCLLIIYANLKHQKAAAINNLNGLCGVKQTYIHMAWIVTDLKKIHFFLKGVKILRMFYQC